MPDSANNRRHERVAVADEAPTITVHLQAVSGAIDTRVVRAHDISRTGMSFAEMNPVKVGTRCIILLQHRQRPLRIIGRVINCRPTEGHRYLVGVKFTSLTQLPVDTSLQASDLVDDPLVDRLMIEV
jgi:hypothetical protein